MRDRPIPDAASNAGALIDWEFAAPDANRARDARRQFRSYLASASVPDDDVDAIEMIYGELIGNVIRHAPGPIEIHFEWIANGALLRVWDSGPGFVEEHDLPDPSAEFGRGLFIIRQLSRSLEIVCDARGCEVRVTLDFKIDRAG